MNSRGAEKGVSDSRFTFTLRSKVVYVNMTYVLEGVYISCVGNKDISESTKEVHIRKIRGGSQDSIQVCIRFGLNDRITLAGFCFQATAIRRRDHSSTVTN